MHMTSIGQMANEMAKHIYRQKRTLVNNLIKAGKLLPGDADKKFAQLVAKDMKIFGLKVSKKILDMMK